MHKVWGRVGVSTCGAGCCGVSAITVGEWKESGGKTFCTLHVCCSLVLLGHIAVVVVQLRGEGFL